MITILIFLGISLDGLAENDVLNIPIFENISSWNPHQSIKTNTNKVFKQIYENLVRLKADGSIEPSLAQKWSFKDGNLKFEIVKGRKFSNGAELTSSHVKESLENSIAMKNLLASQIISIEKSGPHTISLKLSDKNVKLILRKLADAQGFIFNNKTEFLGTGPYEIAEKKKNYILLKRKKKNESNFSEIKFHVTKRESQVLEFNKGKLDEVQSSNPLKEQRAIERYAFSGTLISVINDRGILSSKALRKVILNSIPWRKIANSVLRNGKVADSLIPIGIPGNREIVYKREKIDLNDLEVRKELSAIKNKILTIGTVAKFLSPESKKHFKIALQDLGLEVKFVTEKFGKLLRLFKEGKIDLTFKIDHPFFFEPLAIYNQYLSNSNNNIHSFKDQKFDELYKATEASLDKNSKMKNLKKVNEYLRTKYLLTPIMFPYKFVYFSRKISNVDDLEMSLLFWEYPYRKYGRAKNADQ